MSKKLNPKKAQIAGEKYATFRLQEEAEKMGVATTPDLSKKLYIIFVDYINSIGTSVDSFKEAGLYYSQIEKYAKLMIEGWTTTHKGCTFDLSDMSISGRATKKKGDMLMVLSNGTEIEISLKNYSKDFSNIQVCSGTFSTFILNLLFNSHSIGKCEYKGQYFSTRKSKECEYFIAEWAKDNNISKEPLINVYESAKKINDFVKEKYTKGPFAEWLTPAIEKEWSSDCDTFGNKQIAITIDAMKTISDEVIKQRFLKMIGMSFQSELVCLFPDQYVDSITNLKFKKLVNRLRNESMMVKYFSDNKNICMTASDSEGIILRIMIPFTLNKNGAWLGKNELPEYKAKDKMIVQPMQRRPKKCKELNNSTNVWVMLKEALK
jgi:hypothetical protein